MIKEKKFKKSIWKLIPSAKKGQLAIELRNKDDKKVEYGFLNLESGDYQPVVPSNQDNWWTGLLEFYSNFILLHGYEEEGLPMHKGAMVYDVLSPKILWKDFEVLVKQTGVQGILTDKGDLLGWEDGEVKNQNIFLPLNQLRAEQQVFPSLHLEGDPVFEKWKEPLRDALGTDPVGQIAMATYKTEIFLQACTGTLGKELMGHWLWKEPVVSRLNLISSSTLKGLLLDAFFIELPYLFFTPEENLLLWMNLDFMGR